MRILKFCFAIPFAAVAMAFSYACIVCALIVSFCAEVVRGIYGD